jgi:hypothetical protein
MAKTNMSDEDLVKFLKKEFDRKLSTYCKEKGIVMNDEEDDEEKKEDKPKKEKSRVLSRDVIAAGLRVMHIDSGLEYTIKHVDGSRGIVILQNPMGEWFELPIGEVEAEYELD